MTGYHLAALVVLILWGGTVLFFCLKFRTAIFGGRARHLYRARRREARQAIDEYAEPYGDASTYMIGERTNG